MAPYQELGMPELVNDFPKHTALLDDFDGPSDSLPSISEHDDESEFQTLNSKRDIPRTKWKNDCDVSAVDGNIITLPLS